MTTGRIPRAPQVDAFELIVGDATRVQFRDEPAFAQDADGSAT